MKKIGVWLIGAFGSISITVMLGAILSRKGLCDTTGMLTATEPFEKLGLAPIESLEFGGCDLRQGRLTDFANKLFSGSMAIDQGLVARVTDELDQIEPFVYPGVSMNCGEAIELVSGSDAYSSRSIREEIAYVVSRMNEFKSHKAIDELIVVNVASTEPVLELSSDHNDVDALERLIDNGEIKSIRPSTIYAYAAIQTQSPYINFTPSNGALLPAIVKLAERNGVPVMGNDG